MLAHVSAPTRRGRAIVALLAALAATTGVAACGDDDSGDATAGSTSATSGQSAPAGDTTTGSGVTDYLQYTGGAKRAADSSKDAISIGWVNQQGGPADIGPRATAGAELAVKYVNAALGGVHGHPVKLVTCFTSTSEEQGQTCGQKLTNDKAVSTIGTGAVAIGAQSLMATVDAAKPMVYSVAPGVSDPQNRNGYILFGDLLRVLPPLATFAQQTLHAKSAAVIYPDAPGMSYPAEALATGYKAAGIDFKRVSFAPTATDLLGPLTAAGAQSADVVTPLVLPGQCVNAAKAIAQAKITAQVVASPICLNNDVAKSLGDLPKWNYGIASSLASDTSDPAARAFVAVAQKYGNMQDIADPYYPVSFAEIVTIVKWMNAVGADDITPATIAAQAKAFKGPLALGPPTLECGKYPKAPAVCNDKMKVFKYEGKGAFKPVSGWIGPPQ